MIGFSCGARVAIIQADCCTHPPGVFFKIAEHLMEGVSMSSQTAEQLASKKCQACDGEVPNYTRAEAQKQLAALPGWQLGADGNSNCAHTFPSPSGTFVFRVQQSRSSACFSVPSERSPKRNLRSIKRQPATCCQKNSRIESPCSLVYRPKNSQSAKILLERPGTDRYTVHVFSKCLRLVTLALFSVLRHKGCQIHGHCR